MAHSTAGTAVPPLTRADAVFVLQQVFEALWSGDDPAVVRDHCWDALIDMDAVPGKDIR